MQFLSGNEACALGAIKAGVKFFAGYPITPSTSLMHYMARELPPMGGIFIQMEDEIASICAVLGASIAGMKAMTATSADGFDLMQTAIGYASMAEAPCVIIDVMRAGPSTGLPTKPAQGDLMQAKWGSHGDYPVVVLAPASTYECFELTAKAVNLSIWLQLPVIVLSDESLAHLKEGVTLPDEVETMEWLGARAPITGLYHDDEGFPTSDPEQVRQLAVRLENKLITNYAELVDVESIYTGSKTGIISWGSAASSAKEIAEKHCLSFLRPRIVWPFPSRRTQMFLSGLQRAIVVEMNQGQMYREIQRASRHMLKLELTKAYRIDGKMITPEEIEALL